ncbi:hypothetical protein Bca101_070624 [Brassica carinata]
MEAVIDLFWRVGENQEAVGGEGRRLEPRVLSRSDFPFCRSSMGPLMTARDIGETSPRYQIYLPCDGEMAGEVVKWAKKRCFGSSVYDDVVLQGITAMTL